MRYTTYRSIYEGQTQEETHIQNTLWNRTIELMKTGIGRFILVILILVSGWTGAFSVFAGGLEKPVAEKNVIVQPGDSLWSIAAANKPDDMDTRKYISSISKFNELKGPDIQAGDVLALPVW
ncbi:LysM peptidoglycan-binding domain-containing protein [Paenibacillus dakarensis]|uniref:LysM peptidoglycan-binding domain-containing protein n=1 Tax=Paenibacillus dakarensis TaxID=1527293 RepID=UPI0006D58DC7|nr:LysM peptidoglycan-binding domain-containing protein [Paenibacillus dakarensis]